MFNLFVLNTPAAFSFKEIFSNVRSQWFYYATLFLIIAIIVAIFVAFKPQTKIKQKKTTKIATIAMLTALSFVANVVSIGSNTIKISPVATVSFIAGYLFGPLPGLAVGFCGDLVAAIVYPQGVYNPIISLSSALFGFIPGVIFHYFKGNEIVKTIICFALTYVICSVVLNTTATYLMYLTNSKKYPTLLAYLFARMPITATGQLANLAISLILLPTLRKIKATLMKSSETCAK